jgi:hypothetical protein
MPVAVQPVKFQAPAEVAGTGTTGSLTYETKSGYAGNLEYTVRGLQAATTWVNSVNEDPTCTFDAAHPDAMVAAGVASVSTFTTPPDASLIRFQTFQSDASASLKDVDMYVYRAPPGGTTFAPIGASGNSDANEVVTSTTTGSLAAGAQFRVYLHGCKVDPGGGTFTLFGWALTGSPSNGFSTVPTPQAVSIGQSIPTAFGWDGLPAGNRYLGRVQYFDPLVTAAMGTTVIEVSTR